MLRAIVPSGPAWIAGTSHGSLGKLSHLVLMYGIWQSPIYFPITKFNITDHHHHSICSSEGRNATSFLGCSEFSRVFWGEVSWPEWEFQPIYALEFKARGMGTYYKMYAYIYIYTYNIYMIYIHITYIWYIYIYMWMFNCNQVLCKQHPGLWHTA